MAARCAGLRHVPFPQWDVLERFYLSSLEPSRCRLDVWPGRRHSPGRRSRRGGHTRRDTNPLQEETRRLGRTSGKPKEKWNKKKAQKEKKEKRRKWNGARLHAVWRDCDVSGHFFSFPVVTRSCLFYRVLIFRAHYFCFTNKCNCILV